MSALNAAEATEPADPHWRQFQHALGEPALIGANSGHAEANAAFRPIPAIALQDIDVHRFLLGSDLFHDRRLSSDETIGCITCHGGPLSGTDGRPVSTGVGRVRGNFNALSTLNAAFNFRQFWDGRAVTLADQALLPIASELEMANTLDTVLATLEADQSYVDDFNELYVDGVTINNMADAMAYFQRISFTVTDTAFQRHLNGEQGQLSEQELRGMQRFQEIGCVNCHNGINLGGNSFQRLGVMRAYYPERREAGFFDAGVANRTGRTQDLYAVKVPGLHNASTTMPYFHNGEIPTLATAISEMAIFQLGRQLHEQDVNDIVQFLRTTTGRSTGMVYSREIERLARLTAPQLIRQSGDLPESHAEAYRSVRASIAPLHQRLLAEMHRVNNGEVAHFDFIQFQHLELIRHARALMHPPSGLPAPERRALVEQATTLLEEVMSLEGHISDFLQAHAMTGVHEALLREPHPEMDSDADISAQIERQRAAADRLLVVMRSALSIE